MPTERVIEVPWALSQLPQRGDVLDVGSCWATYLGAVQGSDRRLHCLDLQDCSDQIPPGAAFYQENLLGNSLPRGVFDAVLAISTIEHIGLAVYGQVPFPDGDRMAVAEIAGLLKPGGAAIVTVPAGRSMVASWYRQYSPADLRRLFRGWDAEFHYWGFDGGVYAPVDEGEVSRFTYREPNDGAGAVAGIIAVPPRRYQSAVTER